jgi:nicotinamidase-related amidase
MIDLTFSTINTSVGLHPLIMIDMIKGCSNKKFERHEWDISFERIRKMISGMREFTNIYRSLGAQIVWIRTTPWTEEYLPKNINRLYHENLHATFYTTHDVEESVEFCEELTIQPQDKIFTKNTYSAFANPNLLKFFQEKKEDTYLIAGIFSTGCVDATIIDGFTKGLFAIILSDLVETMDGRQDEQQRLLNQSWPLMYGHVMTSQDFLNRLTESNSQEDLE